MRPTVFALAKKPDRAQIAAIQRGLPSTTLGEIAATLKLPKRTIVDALKLSPRTVSARERSGKPFGPQESERLLRVARVRYLAREAFTSDLAAAKWMTTPKDQLDGQCPLDALETGLGAIRVEALARAMVHGVPL